jgi:hypothetical protein
MPASADNGRAAQVFVQMGIHGPRDVAFQVFPSATIGIGQVKTAIDDDPRRISEPLIEDITIDQSLVHDVSALSLLVGVV